MVTFVETGLSGGYRASKIEISVEPTLFVVCAALFVRLGLTRGGDGAFGG